MRSSGMPGYSGSAWLAVAMLAVMGHLWPCQANYTRFAWDGNCTVASVPFPGPNNRTLVHMDMRNMILYPPDALPFVPASYDLLSIPDGATLSLINSTILTTCPILDAYINYIQENPLAMGTNVTVLSLATDGGNLHAIFTVRSYSQQLPIGLRIEVVNLTLGCDVVLGSFSTARAFANGTQEFESAISSMALLGSNAAVQLRGITSTSPDRGWPLFGFTWRQLPSGPAPTLSISGTNSLSSPNPAVLDLRMSSDVISFAPQQSGTFRLDNLLLVNMCLQNVSLTPDVSTYMSFMFQAFGGERAQLDVSNSLIVVPRFEIEHYIYWIFVKSSVFPEIRSYASDLQISLPSDPYASILSTWSLRFDRFATPRGEFTNVRLQSEDEPLPASVPVNIMAAPVFCSTEPDQPPTPGALYPLRPPLYRMGVPGVTLSQMLSSISMVSGSIMPIAGTQPMNPMVLLQPSGTFLSDTPAVGPPLYRDLAWVGFSRSGLVALDLRQRAAALSLHDGVTVFLHNLRLTNPLEAGVSEQANALRSALPIWAFQFARNTTQRRLVMQDVQLVLPTRSFGPLYALARLDSLSSLEAAQRVYTTWEAIQHPVLNGIRVFNVTWFNVSGILLEAYVGWGCSATNLLITPSTAFAGDDFPLHPFPLNVPPMSAAPLVDSENSATTTVAIVVGVVVGVVGTLIVLGLVWGFCIFRRRRALASTQATSDTEGVKSLSTELEKMECSDGEGGAKQVEEGQSRDSPETLVFNTGTTQHTDASAVHLQEEPEQAPAQPPPSTWDPMKEVEQLVGTVQGPASDTLQLLEPIGNGGFGTVYRGRWRNLDVAVKTVLFSNKTTDAEMGGPERRAIMEAAACSSVVHRNVVATYHYDIKMISTVATEGALQIRDTAGQASDWKLFLVQELCDVSLADAVEACVFHDKLSRQPKLPLVFAVLENVASGMAYIHSKNIIHGDLKPENVLLKHDASSEFGVVAKITDFGLCSTIDPTKSHISGFNNGTPFYVAPEISLTGRAEKQSDVFSFGILLVEVYRGVTPWVKTPKGFRHNRDFMSFPSGTPQLYLQLVKRCLDRKPKNRPQFAEIAETLKVICQLVRQLPTSAAPAPPPERPSPSASGIGRFAPPTKQGSGLLRPTDPGTGQQLPTVSRQALVSGRGSRHLASQRHEAETRQQATLGLQKQHEEDALSSDDEHDPPGGAPRTDGSSSDDG